MLSRWKAHYFVQILLQNRCTCGISRQCLSSVQTMLPCLGVFVRWHSILIGFALPYSESLSSEHLSIGPGNSTSCSSSRQLVFGNYVPLSVKYSSLAVNSPDQRDPPRELNETSLTTKLINSLEEKDPDQAWRALQKLMKIGADFPEEILVKKLFELLARKDALSVFRAHKLLLRLKKENKMRVLSGASIGRLALASAKAEMFDISSNSLRILVKKHYYPTSKLWKTIMEYLIRHTTGAIYAVKIFLEICQYVSKKGQSVQGYNEPNRMLVSMKPDKDAFNIALSACAALGKPEKAEEIIEQMSDFALLPDNTSFCSLIKAYEKKKSIKQLDKVLLRMKQADQIPSRYTLITFLAAYVSLGELQSAARMVLSWAEKNSTTEKGKGMCEEKNSLGREKVCHYFFEFDELIREWRRTLGSPCNEVCTIVLNGLLENERVADAAEFLSDLFYEENSEYVPCGTAIEAVLKLGLRDEVNGVLQKMTARKTPAERLAYIMLVKAYCKLPQPVKGEAVLHDARKVGHLLDVECYDSLIQAYNLLQDSQSAFVVFREMKRHGIVPMEPTLSKFLTVLEKNSNPNLMRKVLEVASRNPPLKMDVHHWNTTVQSFCKAKLLFDAKVVINRMKQLGFEPDASTYVSLFSGYTLQGGKTNEILLLWAEIKEKLAPKSDTTPLKLSEELLNAFLSFFVQYGYFKNALDAVAKMDEQNIWFDKSKYRNMYLYLHKELYTSKHTSPKRVDMSQERRKHVEAFKACVGLEP